MQAAVAYIKSQYHDTMVENLDINVAFCEEVINALEKYFSAELRLFVTDKEQHLVRYPDTIWVSEGYQFVRPKFWIVQSGVERGSFSRHFREMKELRRAQKFNEMSAELNQVKRTLASGGKPTKKNGGDNKSDDNPNSWSDLTRPVKLAEGMLTTEDYHKAAVQYNELCNTVANGKHKDAAGLCWRNSSRLGCSRKSCKHSHAKNIPPAVAKEWAIGQLICAAYGGFKSMPVLHKPNDVSTVVLALKKKLELADNNSNNLPVQAGGSNNAAPPEDLEPPPYPEETSPSPHKKPGSSFFGTTDNCSISSQPWSWGTNRNG